MDTVPFNLMMFAADLCLLIGLWYWPHKRSLLWSLGGLGLGGFLGLCAVALFAKIFRSNIGQCLCEGVFWHGGLFLLAAGILLILQKRRVLGAFPILGGLVLGLLGFDALVYEPYALKLEHYEFRSPKIRAPLRIVFVADIQTDRIGAYEADTFRMIMEQKPDLILLGGDYLQPGRNDPPSKYEHLKADFKRLFQSHPLTAPLGVYAVGGNNDPVSDAPRYRELFEGTGVTTDVNNVTIRDLGDADDPEQVVGPIDLTLLGMWDSFGGYRGEPINAAHYHIMLGHAPTFAKFESQRLATAPDLLLAGHTHGGQVVIPGIGVIVYEKRSREESIPQAWLSGLNPIGSPADGKWLLVTRGSGMERGWAPRIRFLCRPEISVIDLLPE